MTVDVTEKALMDLNADAGESFGRWTLGNDAELIQHITSISVACGFHAGDPATMRRSARLAAETGVALGAHPGFPDRLGFGRRAMQVTPEDLTDYCVYQIGALQAIAAQEGARVEHVKPHGALYTMCTREPAVTEAIVRAVLAVDSELVLLVMDGPAATAAEAAGARVVREAFIDIEYDDDGNLIIEAATRARDPQELAERAVKISRGQVVTTSGKGLNVNAESICIHGDGPNAPAIATAVRARLEAQGVRLASLQQIVASRHHAPVDASDLP